MLVGREPGRVDLDVDGREGATGVWVVERRGFADVVCGRGGGGVGTILAGISGSACAGAVPLLLLRAPTTRRRTGEQLDVDGPALGGDGTGVGAGF
jgi:hypothetical protein